MCDFYSLSPSEIEEMGFDNAVAEEQAYGYQEETKG